MRIDIRNIKKEDFEKVNRLIIVALCDNGFADMESYYMENEKNEHIGWEYELQKS